MAIIGEVNNLTRNFIFEWKIKNFFAVSGENGKGYISPSFLFANETWYMSMYPNGVTKDSVGYVSLYLHSNTWRRPLSLSWSLGLTTFSGKKEHEQQCAYVFGKNSNGYGYPEFVKKSVLLENKANLVPSDNLTIFCNVDYYSKPIDETDNTAAEKCSYCKKFVLSEIALTHEQKCLDKPIRCPTCSDVVALRNWFDHECTKSNVKETERVINGLSDVFHSEKFSDVTVKVKGKEFQLHRNILYTRNNYFRSMFDADMEENRTGLVTINDCEPEIFQAFMYFVYTGKLQSLTFDNVCALYEVSDKYQQDELKEECLCFMKRKISIDSFYEFFLLALKYDEKELLQIATDLFCKETKGFLHSEKWETFMTEYSALAKDLYIKALDYNVSQSKK